MSKLYHWILASHWGCAWSDKDVMEYLATDISYHCFYVKQPYSLLFLEEKQIFSKKRPKSSPGTLWKMLLVDNGRYNKPEIIWVRPEWISPMKMQG